MEKADPGPLVPRCIWSPHLNSQPSHCSDYYPENPGFMSTQAEGNWETKKPSRNWEAEKLEIARHFEMGLFTKEARQCNDMRGVVPLWRRPSRPPPSFQSRKNWGFLACYGWRSALLLHCDTSFLSDHILSLLSFFSFDVIIPQIFIKTYYVPDSPLGITVNKTNCGWLSHILHCRGIRSHTNGQEYVISSSYLPLGHKIIWRDHEGISWQPSGSDSVLSLLGPGFNPWSRN